MGSRCLLVMRVSGYSRVPVPPARITPFIRASAPDRPGRGGHLTLGVLRSLARSLEPVLLALFLARVAGQEPGLLQDAAQLWIGGHKRACDAVAHGTSLSCHSPAASLDTQREAPKAIGCAQRLRHHCLEVAPAKVLAGRPVVDHQAAIAGRQANARHRRLATSGPLVIRLSCRQRCSLPSRRSLSPAA